MHLPTFNPAIGGKTYIEQVAKELGIAPDYTGLKKWMVIMIKAIRQIAVGKKQFKD